MKRLIAKRPILYLGRMYQAGEQLPGGDANMVAAWLRAGTAAWDGHNNDQGAKESAKDTQENDQGTQGDQGGGMLSGHLDPADLEDLKKADLERMASDMGLDISGAKTKADLIAAITAAEVYAPAEDENGGAQ